MSERKTMFAAGHLPPMSPEGAALFNGATAIMRDEVPALTAKRRAAIEAEMDAQDACCRRGVHCGVTYSNGRVERHACCDRPVR